jgi:hypothetical protein
MPGIGCAVLVDDIAVPGKEDRGGHGFGTYVDKQNASQARLNHPRPQQPKEAARLHRQAESATHVDVEPIEGIGQIRFRRGDADDRGASLGGADVAPHRGTKRRRDLLGIGCERELVQERRLLSGGRAGDPCAHLEGCDARVPAGLVDLSRKRIHNGARHQRRAHVGERKRDPAPSPKTSAYLDDRNPRHDSAGSIDEPEHERLERV